MSINLYWCLSPNFGDALSPWLAEKITGKRPVFVSANSSTKKYLICGSILNWAEAQDTVWGAGLASLDDGVNEKTDIRAVRGPLTQMVARKRGAKCPPVYGDPAFLLPRYIKPSVKEHCFGVVPHYVDMQRVLSAWRFKHPEVLVIDPLRPVEEVVQAITSCERIASSSLHGLIVAGAYGIPAVHVDFDGESIGGDGLKYADYWASVGLPAQDKVKIAKAEELKPEALRTLTFQVPREPEAVAERLWAVCPFRPGAV